MSQIHERYISVVTAFRKKVRNSLVTLCFSPQIIKNDKVPFLGIDKLSIIEIVWDTPYKFYTRNSLLKVFVQGLPLSKTP